MNTQLETAIAAALGQPNGLLRIVAAALRPANPTVDAGQLEALAAVELPTYQAVVDAGVVDGAPAIAARLARMIRDTAADTVAASIIAHV